MRYLITGVTGQLGHDVAMELYARGGCEILGAGRSETYSGICDDYINKGIPYTKLELTGKKEVFDLFDNFRPDHVIHCASWTKVDAAEWPENRNAVLDANVIATAVLTSACRKYNACLTYISTDYVFGNGDNSAEVLKENSIVCEESVAEAVVRLTEKCAGNRLSDMSTDKFPDQLSDGSYDELASVSDRLCSANFYGRTKLMGELIAATCEKHYIVRVSWSFGVNGSNFVKTMLRLGESRQITPEQELTGASPSPITIVNDQIGRLTYTYDAAGRILDIIGHGLEYGTYHAVNGGGFASWYDIAKVIFDIAGMRVPTVPISAEAYEASVRMAENKKRADRPYNSRLVCEKAENQGLAPMRTWKEALSEYIRAL